MARKPITDKHAIPEGEAGTPFSDYIAEDNPEHRGRGRAPGFRMSHEHRSKIKNSLILSKLGDHFEGTITLTDSQVRVGFGLLAKVLPDLRSVTIGGDPLSPVVHEHKVDLTVYSVEELKTLRSILAKKAA